MMAFIICSQAILAKQFRKERRALLREMEGPKLKAMKKGILTDLAIISLAFLLLFTGFNGLYTLQTTVNDQLGADALWFVHFRLDLMGITLEIVNCIGEYLLIFAFGFCELGIVNFCNVNCGIKL
jgi:hypothetical protein